MIINYSRIPASFEEHFRALSCFRIGHKFHFEYYFSICRSARDDVTQMLKRGGGADGGAAGGGGGQQLGGGGGGRRLAAVEQWARQSSTAGTSSQPTPSREGGIPL